MPDRAKSSPSSNGFVFQDQGHPLKKFLESSRQAIYGSKKNLGVVLLLVFGAALPLALLISQKQQELRQRAALEGSRIEIVGPNVVNGVAISRNVKLKLTYVTVAASPTEVPAITVVPTAVLTTPAGDVTPTVSPSEAPPTATSVPPTSVPPTGTPVPPTAIPATPTIIPRTCGSPITACQADVNRDGVVTILDRSSLVSSTCFNKPKPASGPCSLGDFNGNGIIDRQDVACMQEKFDQEDQDCPTNRPATTGVQGAATAQEASTTISFRVSNDQNTLEQAQVQSFTPEELTALTKEIDWQLTEGNGAKTVFAQFKFGDAAWESVLSTTVTLTESTASVSTTFNLPEQFSSSTQGVNNWYYHYLEWGGSLSTSELTFTNSLNSSWTKGPGWTVAGGQFWVHIDSQRIVPGDGQKVYIYWKAPGSGQATIDVSSTKTDDQGEGYKIGVAYSSSVGTPPSDNDFFPQASFNNEKIITVNGGDFDPKQLTGAHQMNGNDTLIYYVDSNGSARGDVQSYNISINFTSGSTAAPTSVSSTTQQTQQTGGGTDQTTSAATPTPVAPSTSTGPWSFSSTFSSTQGQNDLTYLAYANGNYYPATWDSSRNKWTHAGPGTDFNPATGTTNFSITQGSIAPSGGAAAVVRWTSNVSGDIAITGSFTRCCTDPPGNQVNTIYKVRKDDTDLWSKETTDQTRRDIGDSPNGRTTPVVPGTRIEFWVDPAANGSGWDGSTVDFTITYKPPTPTATPVDNNITVTYNLYEGANFIGIPVNTSLTPAEVLNKTNGKCDYMGSFDPIRERRLDYYTDPRQEVFNNLTSIESGVAYTFRCSDNVTFELRGSPRTNLPSLEPVNVNFVSLPGKFNGRSYAGTTVSDLLRQVSTGNLRCNRVDSLQTDNSWIILSGTTPLEISKGYNVSCSPAR